MAEIKTLTVNGETYTVADPDAAHIDDAAVGENAWSSGKIAQATANALKGEVSGNPVGIVDSSSLEHAMAVQLTSQTETDFSSVTVTKQGFNWFDQETRFTQLGYAKQADGSWLGNTYHGKLATPPVQAEGPVYVKITAKATSEIGVPLLLRAYYTDGTNEQLLSLSKSMTEFTTLKGVTKPQKTLSYLQLSYGGNTGETAAFYIRDVVASYADGAYVPYTAETQTFQANGDGSVTGIVGNGEAMTLVADTQGVTITARYNRDANQVIAKLEEKIAVMETAMVSLVGGNE